MTKLLHWFKSEIIILKSARDACAFHNFKQTLILCIWFYSTCTSSGMGILLLKYVEAILVVLALLALIGWFSFGAVPSLSPSPLPVWSSILFLMKILAHIINLSLICLEINKYIRMFKVIIITTIVVKTPHTHWIADLLRIPNFTQVHNSMIQIICVRDIFVIISDNLHASKK